MAGGMMGGDKPTDTITASNVELEPRGISVTGVTAITSGAQTSVTMTLPAGFAFTTLTGATSDGAGFTLGPIAATQFHR
jgi:hypothetical protein